MALNNQVHSRGAIYLAPHLKPRPRPPCPQQYDGSTPHASRPSPPRIQQHDGTAQWPRRERMERLAAGHPSHAVEATTLPGGVLMWGGEAQDSMQTEHMGSPSPLRPHTAPAGLFNSRGTPSKRLVSTIHRPKKKSNEIFFAAGVALLAVLACVPCCSPLDRTLGGSWIERVMAFCCRRQRSSRPWWTV